MAHNRAVLEEGIVQDGKILNKEKLVEKLKEVLKDIKAKKAILSLPESKIFIGDFKIIPWRPEEVYTDKINNLQIAAPKEIVNQYIEVVKLSGVDPIVIDIESISLGRALMPEQSQIKSKESTIIMDIGARTANLGIFNSSGVLQNSITVPIAGNNFTKAIAEKLNIKTEEAEALKIKLGFDASDTGNKVLPVLQSSFQPIVKELKDAISYYENSRGKKIKEIILAGGSALLPKIDEYLAVNLDKKVKIGDPLARLKSGQLADKKENSVLFSNVIGLALRGIGDISKGINLLPREHKSIKA